MNRAHIQLIGFMRGAPNARCASVPDSHNNGYDATGAQTEKHQKRMMGEVAKLIGSGDGVLKEDVYERTAQALLDQKIIEKTPEGAWTHEITDEALK